MNRLFKKAAAVLTAAVMASASLGAEVFAQSGIVCSQTKAIAYEATVAKPGIAIKGSLGKRKILLSTTTSGATIYYTTNGTTPTTSSKKYKTGTLLQITSNKTIKAIAVKGSAKSAVMTKAVKVTQVYGDVNGDGKVNQSDYTRLRNYFAGKTSYICKDNADTNGSGGLSTKDLEVLSLYLNGTIDTLPYKSATSLKTPYITVYSSIGCKKVEFTSSQSGVSFYYTLNGETPTIRSTKYTEKFPIYQSATIKVIAYKDGISSSVKTVDVKVSQCEAVQTLTPVTTKYDNAVQVKLSCATTDAKIYYTTDGTDPRTSTTARLYYDSISLTKDTAVKAFAQAKGCSDSIVSTFNYVVSADSGFEISGYVWNDTPTETSIANGIRTSTEPGISGITVNLINTLTNRVDSTTTTLSDGSYVFKNLERGKTYKVEFKYNYQKYRPYGSIVTGGNQALATMTSIPSLTIKNSGAYDTATGKLAINCNSFSTASINSYFDTTAVTTAAYNNTAANVNLAMITNCAGSLSLVVTSTGQDTAKLTVTNTATMTYNVSLSNLSLTETLRDVVLDVYITNAFSDITFVPPVNNTKFSAKYVDLSNGFLHYTVTGLLTSELASAGSANFSITAKVNASAGTKLQCYAQVSEYSYKSSCYEKASIPGNLVVGSVKEKDESASPLVTVESNTAPAPVKSINLIGNEKITLDIGGNTAGANKTTYYIEVVNGDGKESLLVINNNTAVTTTQPQKATSTTGNVYTVDVTGVNEGTGLKFEIWLMEGNTVLQKKTITVDVVKTAAAT